MHFWLPYTKGGSGADSLTLSLASALQNIGHETVLSRYSKVFQFAPALLMNASPPGLTETIIANSWTAYPFANPRCKMIVVVHLCVHDPQYRQFKSPAQNVFHKTIVRRSEAKAFEKADCVVAVSQATAKGIKREFPGIDPLVIPNGIDTDFFSPGPSPKAPNDDRPFRLLFVGNPSARKGSDLLVATMELLGPDFELRVTSGLQDRIAPGGPNIVNVGKLDRTGVLSAYREADALFFPTRLEGMPLVVLEAMACGTPVVGTNLSSMPEVVDHGKTGLLATATPRSLADAIRTLASNPGRRAAMSVASRDKAVMVHSLGAMAKKYANLAQSL